MDYSFSQKNLHCGVIVVPLSTHARKMNMLHDGESSVTLFLLTKALKGTTSLIREPAAVIHGKKFHFPIEEDVEWIQKLPWRKWRKKNLGPCHAENSQALVQPAARCCTELDTPSPNLRIYVLWQTRSCMSGWEVSVSP